MTSPALSVKDVAKQLGLRTHSILTLIKNGSLVAVDVSLAPGGRPRWRILQDDLDGFLARRTRQTPTPRRRKRKQSTNIRQYF